MKLKMILSTVLVVCAGMLFADTGRVRPIPTSEVVVEPSVKTRVFPGKVRASRRVDLGFNVSGQLVYISAAEGSHVKKDELLAELDKRDFEYALDAAKASFDQARANYDRKKGLFEKKVISQAELDQAEAVFASAKASYDHAKKNLEDTALHAPFDAVISKRMIENHEQVIAKRTVMSLRDVSRVEVVIPVPAALIAAAKPELIESIEVKFDADHDRWYTAEVAEFATESNVMTQTYDVVVSLPAPDDINVFTGMSAQVQVKAKTESEQKGVLIPFESVFRMAGNDYVWIIPENGGHPQRSQVVTSGFYESKVRVVKGIQAGVQVAIAGMETLSEDANVRPSRKDSKGLNQ